MTEKETYRGEKILILILMLAVSASGWFMYNAVDLTGPQIPPEKGDPLYIMSHSPSQLLDSVDVDHLTSRNATVFDLENSKVIYSKAANKKTRPASLTKMMTCLVAIENIKDLNDKFTFSSKLINKLDVQILENIQHYLVKKLVKLHVKLTIISIDKKKFETYFLN